MVPVSSSVKPYRRINDILGKNDGYVLNSVHNIQLELPPENIVVMYDEGRGDPLDLGKLVSSAVRQAGGPVFGPD